MQAISLHVFDAGQEWVALSDDAILPHRGPASVLGGTSEGPGAANSNLLSEAETGSLLLFRST
jgi:hypothetical protein